MARSRPLPTPRDGTGRFRNWARSTASAPVRWHFPHDEDAVAALVAEAHREGRRLRPVGAGHSWSAVNVPETDAVSLDRWDAGAPRIHDDRSAVTTGAGIRLRDLSAVLAQDGLALPIVGSIQAQSVAGAIATGTHGSSLRYGNLADLVLGMRVVTGRGEIADLPAGDPRLAAARVHLGALGIVTGVTLPVRPARRLRQTVTHLPVAEMPGALGEIAASAEYVKVWWLPHAPAAQVVRYDETDAPLTRRPTSATARWVDERVMHRFVFPPVVAVQQRRPAITPGLARWLSQRYLGKPVQVGPDMLLLNTPMPLRHRETEAALPLARAGGALTELLGIFRGSWPAALFPLEIRFVRGDGNWLSPAYGADACQVGAYAVDGPDTSAYFDAFWAVMRRHDARPHWGKEFDHRIDELRPLYPWFDEFREMRREWDPAGVFAGPAHRRILGE